MEEGRAEDSEPAQVRDLRTPETRTGGKKCKSYMSRGENIQVSHKESTVVEDK